jgi:hypothetical protein
MYKKYLLFLFFLFPPLIFADQITYTASGKKVLLKDDGTWTYFSESINKWSVNDTKDPLDDSQVIYCVLLADSGEGTYHDPVTLVVRITRQNNETVYEIYINWNSYLADSNQEVFFRFDDGEALKEDSLKSTNSKATFFRNPKDIIQKLVNSSRFVARTTPYSESPITAVFDVSGLKEILAKYPIKLPES